MTDIKIKETVQKSKDGFNSALMDSFGRTVTYLRLSVTDRCDLRCTYCMSEKMKFLPKSDLLDEVELEAVARAFIARGVTKIRVTGGEPLVRRNILSIMTRLSTYLGKGLEELTLTTNGTQLSKHSQSLAKLGVKRINISLDSLIPETFARVTRGGRLEQVLDGIASAQANGMTIKLNVVALKRDNRTEIPSIIKWAHHRDIDVSLIEAMPLGDIDEDRYDQYIPLSVIRAEIDKDYTLVPDTFRTGGPSRYFQVKETGGRLGFISPLSNNFCGGCNRVRLTCTGKLFLCLGRNDDADLRQVLRSGGDLDAALTEAMTRKPEAHEFKIESPGAAPAVRRHMSMTGG